MTFKTTAVALAAAVFLPGSALACSNLTPWSEPWQITEPSSARHVDPPKPVIVDSNLESRGTPECGVSVVTISIAVPESGERYGVRVRFRSDELNRHFAESDVALSPGSGSDRRAPQGSQTLGVASVYLNSLNLTRGPRLLQVTLVDAGGREGPPVWTLVY